MIALGGIDLAHPALDPREVYALESLVRLAAVYRRNDKAEELAAVRQCARLVWHALTKPGPVPAISTAAIDLEL